MRAAVRSISSPDVDVRTYQSDDPTDDAVFLTVYAGPAGSIGEESFDLTVCTPLWLSRKASEEGPVLGRHLLIVAQLDMAEVDQFLTRRFESYEAPDWATLADKLGRIGHWEFEDYRP